MRVGLRRALPVLLAALVAGCVGPGPERALSVTPMVAPPHEHAGPGPIALTPFTFTGTISQGGMILGAAPLGSVSVTLDGKPIALADGRFIAGFDRDAAPGSTLVATLGDGRTVIRQLAIAPRAWDISRLDTLAKYPVPDAEFARLRPPELAQIAAARAIKTDAQGWRQAMVWPTTGRVSTLFGSQRIYKGEPGSYHSGIDIAKPTGSVVVAPADGVVILAADHPFTLEGNLLMIDHGMGLNSAFLHLSRIDVHVGDHVRQGQPIALSGMTGRATGPHLHWSLRWNEAKLDPLLVAGPMRSSPAVESTGPN